VHRRRESLAELQDAWLAHVRFTEDEDGLFEELVADNPEAAASEVDHLRRDLRGPSLGHGRAGELLGADGAGPAEPRLRDALKAVGSRSTPTASGALKLLYNVYSVDPTGGG